MLLILAVLFCTGTAFAQERVVNGTDSDITRWPFTVSLRAGNSHSCGGVAISENWILTAAHCVQSTLPGRYTILHSSTSLLYAADENVVQIAEVITHPNYYPRNNYIHDIGLLRLEQPISLSTYGRLPPQFDDLSQGVPATLVGWGLNETGGYLQTTLQEVELIVFSDEECGRRHNESPPHASNICAGVPEGGKGQCSGDSGGPLVWEGLIVGLVSWSVKPCTVYPYPGVYTQVSYYREWIRQVSGV